jgi:hypothetical protein
MNAPATLNDVIAIDLIYFLVNEWRNAREQRLPLVLWSDNPTARETQNAMMVLSNPIGRQDTARRLLASGQPLWLQVHPDARRSNP